MADRAAPVLAFDGVSIHHAGRTGRTPIIEDVSFEIAPGEAFGLVGESGCGKSTVALAAMRYLPAGMSVTAGRIVLEGRDLAAVPAAELTRIRGRRIAMVYQDPMSSLNPVMTVGDQLAEVSMLHGETDRRAARARAEAMLAEVRIPDTREMLARYPHQLSGGQQQRVVIAMALIAEPALLVMDEPTTALDVTIEAAILELVRELRQRFGSAILFISHNLGTVARLCDRIGVLYAGRMAESGPVRAVFRRPAHPYTRGLLAALPRLDAARGRSGATLAPVRGTLAAEDRRRPGCAFAPRCDLAVPAICSVRPVPLVAGGTDAGHRVRCARPEAIAAGAAPDGRDGAESDTPESGAEAHPVLLEVSELTKVYEMSGTLGRKGRGRIHALTDASLEARAGSTLAIVGESGSGKSTLAKVLAGLHSATRGHARLGGSDLAQMPVDARPKELRRRLQMVFQNPDSTLNPSHTVAFALSRPLRVLRGLSRAEARAEAERLMERVQLPPELLARKPHQLSGGQRQRVAIARALAGDPELVIADEPVSALDVSVQASIVNLLQGLQRSGNLGLVLISHDLALVRHMADWVAVMYLGRIVEYGPADAVLSPPFHPYTEALLAAAPRPDPDAGAPEIVLSGAMPSAAVEIEGCPFASRCPRSLGATCECDPPPVRRNGPHRIACHLDLAWPAGRQQDATAT